MALNVKAVFNAAVDMEKDGRTFYEYAAKNVDNPEVAVVLETLAREEKFHEDVFLKMGEEVPGDEAVSSENEELLNYLKESFDSKQVFDKEKFEKEKDGMNSIVDVLDFAMDREHEAVLYYTALMSAVKEEFAALVQKIVKEESGHFVKLMHAKKLIIGK